MITHNYKVAETKPEKKIVVLTSGWVFIGVWHAAEGTKTAFLTDASNVRAWGTTAGLGELALKGPTDKTVLDPCGIVVFDNPAAVLFTHPCSF